MTLVQGTKAYRLFFCCPFREVSLNCKVFLVFRNIDKVVLNFELKVEDFFILVTDRDSNSNLVTGIFIFECCCYHHSLAGFALKNKNSCFSERLSCSYGIRLLLARLL